MCSGKLMVPGPGCRVPGKAETRHPARGTSRGQPLRCGMEKPPNIADGLDVGESGADVPAVGDAFREPADDRAGLVQLPLLGLRSALDLAEVALHRFDAAVQLVRAVV